MKNKTKAKKRRKLLRMAEEKISIPRFNGTNEAFETWWIKFYFYA